MTVGELRGDQWWPGPQLRPWEIGRLTFPEVALLIGQAEARSRSGGAAQSDLQIETYAAWYWALTPAEKVNLAREGKL